MSGADWFLATAERMMLAAGQGEHTGVSVLRLAVGTAVPLAEATAVAFERRYGVWPAQGFGIIEAGLRRLVKYCRERLASYKVPVRFRLVVELPRTANGKLRR